MTGSGAGGSADSTCPTCGSQVVLTPTGELPTHANAQGNLCEGAGLPAWVRRSAQRPATAPTSWGLGAVLVGMLLSIMGVAADASGLVIFGWVSTAGGVVMLCLGVARLVAKADAAYSDRTTNSR